jgi:hypothetical protein
MKDSHVFKNSSTIVGNHHFTTSSLNLIENVRTKYFSAQELVITILSMPLGPKEVRIASPTAKKIKDDDDEYYFFRVLSFFSFLPLAAVMFDMRTSMGLSLS